MNTYDEPFDDEEEIRINRRLGIDDNREGDEWNQGWTAKPNYERCRHCGRRGAHFCPATPKPAPEPQQESTDTELCIDCRRPLRVGPGGCRCWLT